MTVNGADYMKIAMIGRDQLRLIAFPDGGHIGHVPSGRPPSSALNFRSGGISVSQN